MSISEAAKNYEAATQEFLHLVKTLSESDLNRADAQGWTPRQIIHHLADSEAQSYARLRRLIAEPGTLIQGYDEGKWAENSTLDYSNGDIEAALEVFSAVRKSSHLLISKLTESERKNSCTHSESGEYTVEDWLRTYTLHPREHAEQIRTQLNA